MAKFGYHLLFKRSEKERFSAVKERLGFIVDFESYGDWNQIYEVLVKLTDEELIFVRLSVSFVKIINVDEHGLHRELQTSLG